MKNNFKNLLDDQFTAIKKSRDAIIHGIFLGLIVGLAIFIYDFTVNELLINKIKNITGEYIYILPIIGFIITGVLTKLGKLDNPSLADEIVQSYHSGVHNIRLKQSLYKLFGSIATVSFGASAGLEGGAKWLGGVLGVFYNRFVLRFPLFKKLYQDPNTTMMSGAAAGISAVFRAPLSGTILALESPYKKDFAHEPLFQAFLSSAISYTVFTLLKGPGKFFNINIAYNLRVTDFFFALLIGVLAGLFSNLMLKTNSKIKEIVKFNNIIFTLRFLIGGIMLSLLAYISFQLTHSFSTMYSGYDIIDAIFKDQIAVNTIILILILKMLAFIITFSFGGIGGQFLPSAAIGACIGFLVQHFFGLDLPVVFPLIGMSAFITASYNGLLFGPVLIAEITGQPNLVVIGIMATTISFLISNGVSNSQHQKLHR